MQSLANITLPTRPEPLQLDAGRSALIVIDMQNAYLSKRGYIDLVGFDVSKGPDVIAAVARVVAACRSVGLPIIHTQNGFSPEFLERDVKSSPLYLKSNALRYMRDHLEHDGKLIIEGTWDFGLVQEIEPGPGDILIKKARYSAFCGTALDSVLRARRIDTLIVVGVNTNVCVESTIRDAYHREYFTIMVPDATMPSGDAKILDATVFNVERFFGWTIATEDLCRALNPTQTKAARAATSST